MDGSLFFISDRGVNISEVEYSFNEVSILSSPSINLKPSHRGLIDGTKSYKSFSIDFTISSIF